jgi:hypothetical protein
MTFTAGIVANTLDTDADGVDSACESLAGERRLLEYVRTETWPDGTIQSRYAFRHALFQHAALARSTAATVRTWHRKIAEHRELNQPALVSQRLSRGLPHRRSQRRALSSLASGTSLCHVRRV